MQPELAPPENSGPAVAVLVPQESAELQNTLRDLNALCIELRSVIRNTRNAHAAQYQTKSIIAYLIQIILIVLLIGRALSCTFRYLTTNEALKNILPDEQWAMILSEVSAVFLCTADTFITVLGSSNGVKKLSNLPKNLRWLLDEVRDDAGKLPYIKLALLIVCLGINTMGSFYKGYTGLMTASLRFSSVFTDTPPNWFKTILSILSPFSGVSSAFVAFSFFGDQALENMRINKALQAHPEYSDLLKQMRCQRFRNLCLTMGVSFGAGALNVLARLFYDNPSELNTRNITEISMIAFSPIVLSVGYTIYHKLNNFCIETYPEKFDWHKLNWIAKIGIVSSIGTAIAPISSIIHLSLLASHQKNIRQESVLCKIIWIICAIFLAIPTFIQDFIFATKTALESNEKNQLAREQSVEVINVDSDERPLPIVAAPTVQSRGSWVGGRCDAMKVCLSRVWAGMFARKNDEPFLPAERTPLLNVTV